MGCSGDLLACPGRPLVCHYHHVAVHCHYLSCFGHHLLCIVHLLVNNHLYYVLTGLCISVVYLGNPQFDLGHHLNCLCHFVAVLGHPLVCLGHWLFALGCSLTDFAFLLLGLLPLMFCYGHSQTLCQKVLLVLPDENHFL